MDNNIPFAAYEAALERQESANEEAHKRQQRTILLLWILCIILFVSFALSNLAWIIYEHQFEDVATTQEVWQSVDGDGSNRFVGGDYYGGVSEGADSDQTESSDSWR